MLRAIDAESGWALFGFGVDGARAVMTGLVASVFTFVVFVFSILLVAVQIASANLSPRVIAGLLSHRPVRICLGVMVFAFVYGLAVLGRIETSVQQLPLAVAVGASVASIVTFLYLIDHLARALRPVSVLSWVGREGARVIEAMYPARVAGSDEGGSDAPRESGADRVVCARGGGVVLAFDGPGLVALARRADCVIELLPQVGDFVAKGGPLFRLHGKGAGPGEDDLHGRLALGDERTMEQDPAFPFRIIVDIAAKALSPAINDPTTAVLAIDQIHHLLRNLAGRRLDTGRVEDRDGRLRLVYRTPGWEEFVALAVTEIRHFGASSMQVARRLRAMLEDLIQAVPPGCRPPLHAELLRLRRAAERAFGDPDDRAQAERGDSQGLGGHEPRLEPGA